MTSLLNHVKDTIDKNGGANVAEQAKQALAAKVDAAIKELVAPIIATMFVLSLIMLVVYVVLCGLHLWRFKQSKCKYHLMLAGGLSVAIAGQAILVTTKRLTILAVAFPVNALANWIALAATALLLARWGRSMAGHIGNKSRPTFLAGIGGIGLSVVGTILVVAAWILLITAVAARNLLTIATHVLLFYKLFRTGHGLLVSVETFLLVVAVFSLVLTAGSHAPVINDKRKQLVILILMLGLLVASDMTTVLLFPYASYIVMAVYYSVGLYSPTVLAGFDVEPERRTSARISNMVYPSMKDTQPSRVHDRV